MTEEETEEERKKRWWKKEAAKERSKTVKCSKCSKEVDEFMDISGRILCIDCYIAEEEKEGRGALDMAGEAGGGG